MHTGQHGIECAFCGEILTAQQRINDNIGVLRIWDANGKYDHTETTQEYQKYLKVLSVLDTRKAGRRTQMEG